MKLTVFTLVAFVFIALPLQGQFKSDVIPTSGGDLEMFFIGHGSLMFKFKDHVIHIDPAIMMQADYSNLPDADLILLTHQHSDHLDLKAIKQLLKDKTSVVMTRTINKEAYDFYLMGLYYWDKLSQESLKKALDYFNNAIALDPEWALPYSGVAQVWVGMAQMGFASPETSGPIIFENLSKALELDPRDASSHYTQALIAAWVQWNWEAGEQGFKTALELNPSDAMSHIYYAHLLVCLNRNEEALVHGEKAVELDPLNPLILSLYAVVLSSSDQLDYALVNLEKALSIDPYNFFAHHVLEFVSYDVGDSEEFLRAIRFIFPLEEETFQSIERIAANDGLQSAYEELVANLEILSKSTFLVPVHFANRYIRIHQNEKALDQLELGLQVHDQNMPYLTCRFLGMEPLFGYPRFQALVDTLKLPMPEEY